MLDANASTRCQFWCPKHAAEFGSRSLFKFSVRNCLLFAQLEVPVRGFSNFYTKGKVQGALGGIKIVIYARVPC
jgi:hypothetical protein